MPIFQSADTPTWTWLSTVSGIHRETSYIRHDISRTYSDHFDYGVPGEPVNDLILRHAILENNLIYRFDYDEPGLRLSRLARIYKSPVTPLVTFTQSQSRATIQSAHAVRCDNGIHLNLEWGNIGFMTQPIAVFVHGYSSDGKQVLVADRDLIDGYMPIDQVPFGFVIEEMRLLKSSETSVNEVHIGLYNRVNTARFTVSDASGSALVGDEYIIRVVEPTESCD